MYKFNIYDIPDPRHLAQNLNNKMEKCSRSEVIISNSHTNFGISSQLKQLRMARDCIWNWNLIPNDNYKTMLLERIKDENCAVKRWKRMASMGKNQIKLQNILFFLNLRNFSIAKYKELVKFNRFFAGNASLLVFKDWD